LYTFEFMETKIPGKYLWTSFFLSLAIALTIHFSLIVDTLFNVGLGRHGEQITLSFIAFDFSSTVILAFLTFMLNYHFFKPFSTHHKLNITKIAGSMVITFVFAFILAHLFIFFKHLLNFQINQHRHDEGLFFRNFYCSAIVLASIFVIRLNNQKKSIELENEKLRNESLQSQFESLKNQVSPHFLFNSLTALKILVTDSPDLARQYITHLSMVLRYTLQSNRKQLVPLGEEMEFTQSYLFLLKMRYDTNLTVQTRITDKYFDYRLPPLTVQTLVENAVKHNEISNQYPLQINIQTTDEGSLGVMNKIQEKLTQEDGTGIGLSNLSKLFRLLGDYDIQIFNSNKEFRVVVPLLKP